jgi:hypothetical protein
MGYIPPPAGVITLPPETTYEAVEAIKRGFGQQWIGLPPADDSLISGWKDPDPRMWEDRNLKALGWGLVVCFISLIGVVFSLVLK